MGEISVTSPGYRGTSLTRNRFPLGPYGSPMPIAIWWSYGGGGGVLMSEVPLCCTPKRLFDSILKFRHCAWKVVSSTSACHLFGQGTRWVRCPMMDHIKPSSEEQHARAPSKNTTHLDPISHCKPTSGTTWSNRWTCHNYSPGLI